MERGRAVGDAAIREGRETYASVEQVLPCYRVLNGLERHMGW